MIFSNEANQEVPFASTSAKFDKNYLKLLSTKLWKETSIAVIFFIAIFIFFIVLAFSEASILPEDERWIVLLVMAIMAIFLCAVCWAIGYFPVMGAMKKLNNPESASEVTFNFYEQYFEVVVTNKMGNTIVREIAYNSVFFVKSSNKVIICYLKVFSNSVNACLEKSNTLIIPLESFSNEPSKKALIRAKITQRF